MYGVGTPYMGLSRTHSYRDGGRRGRVASFYAPVRRATEPGGKKSGGEEKGTGVVHVTNGTGW